MSFPFPDKCDGKLHHTEDNKRSIVLQQVKTIQIAVQHSTTLRYL